MEAALHAAHARTSRTLHAGAAAAGPELGSRAQRPQGLECPQALCEAGSDGRDSEDEEEEGGLLAFVAALDFDRFAQELERSAVQASLTKGVPSPTAWPLIAQPRLHCLASCSCLKGEPCTAYFMRRHLYEDPEPAWR